MARSVQEKDDLREDRRWEKMRRRGHLIELTLDALLMIGIYIVIRLIHVACFKVGWVRSPGATSLEGIVVWTISWLAVREWDWQNLKRKFPDLPPREGWMAK
jgi:hypothetical protein